MLQKDRQTDGPTKMNSNSSLGVQKSVKRQQKKPQVHKLIKIMNYSPTLKIDQQKKRNVDNGSHAANLMKIWIWSIVTYTTLPPNYNPFIVKLWLKALPQIKVLVNIIPPLPLTLLSNLGDKYLESLPLPILKVHQVIRTIVIIV